MNHVSVRSYSDGLVRSSKHNPFAAIMVVSAALVVCVDRVQFHYRP
jgi:hypothetical protein